MNIVLRKQNKRLPKRLLSVNIYIQLSSLVLMFVLKLKGYKYFGSTSLYFVC